jgi:hypothetical protein
VTDLREAVCIARHGYHLIEWYQSGLDPSHDPYYNDWRCRWCRVAFPPVVAHSSLDLRSQQLLDRVVYVRMNGPICVSRQGHPRK